MRGGIDALVFASMSVLLFDPDIIVFVGAPDIDMPWFDASMNTKCPPTLPL